MVKALYITVDIGRTVQLFNMRLHALLGVAEWLAKLISIAFEHYRLMIQHCSGVFKFKVFSDN